MSPKPETVTSQAEALAKGSTTSGDLIRTALRRAEERADLNAFVSLDSDVVLDQAKASDARRSAGKTLSPIDGVPVAIKDNYLTRDFPTTACSRALPQAAIGVDATVVANLRAAGAIIFGKTNMHEWAFGATNTTSSIGPTRNPHNTDHITGGSSGGSAAAVAAGIVGAALGSDTGGSVRIPSAACGVYGFKPTYGRASRHGVLPLSWSLDAPGPIAQSLDDLALLLPFFLGSDPNDMATAQANPFEKQSAPDSPIILNLVGKGLERSEEVDLAVRTALNRGGASMKDATIPHMRSFFAAWEAILHVEASSYHEKLLTDEPAAFTSVTRAHLEAGRHITALQAMHAQKLRACFIEFLLNGLGEWDALALPTLPVPAPKHGQDWQSFGGRDVTTQDSMTWFCWAGNLAGLPCISLPVDTSTNGLPISMMLMGRPGKDESLLEIAYQFDNLR